MLTSLSSKSQITIPAPIISQLGLKEGDQFEIFEDKGMISIIPVKVYPKEYIDSLISEITELKNNIKSGKQPIFDNVNALFDALDK